MFLRFVYDLIILQHFDYLHSFTIVSLSNIFCTFYALCLLNILIMTHYSNEHLAVILLIILIAIYPTTELLQTLTNISLNTVESSPPETMLAVRKRVIEKYILNCIEVNPRVSTTSVFRDLDICCLSIWLALHDKSL